MGGEDSRSGGVRDGGPGDATRKQVTVLFCDVVGYTSRAQALDPEDLADDIRVFQSICTEISHRYGGHISNYLGDGMLVLFGHPSASEFGPEYAVRAGLEMVTGIRQNNNSFKWRNREPLNVRVGIATSLVVVGERAGTNRDQDELIFGEAPTLAARLQDLASPNTVVTSLRTRRLVGCTFKFRDMGMRTLKGFRQPVPVWEILGESSEFNRRFSPRRIATEFISRDRELAFLSSCYESCLNGTARFIHIVGEAGIGKSRLIRVFERTLDRQRLRRVRINCSPFYESTPFWPVQRELRRWLDIDTGTDAPASWTKISTTLSAMSMDTEHNRLLLCEILSVMPPRKPRGRNPSAEEKHRSTIILLFDMLQWLGRNDPLILVLEDLHWADPSTLELLDQLISNWKQASLFAVLSSRPEFSSPWKQSDQFTVQRVGKLNARSSYQLIRSICDGNQFPAHVEAQLVSKSDGVPLYLEECIWNLLEDPANLNTGTFSVPETLQDSLNARLDSLGPAKELAQIAAVFGHQFTYSDIQKIALMNGIEADMNMDALLESELIKIIPQVEEDQYTFRHSLFQDAAYHSLLKSRRQIYHGQVAELLSRDHPEIHDAEPELLAYHYTRSDEAGRAIDLWLKAGIRALATAATAEALSHLEEGLGQLGRIPGSDARESRELSLRLNLAVCLTLRSGYHSRRVTETYRRCVDLSERFGDKEQKWGALYGYWRCTVCTGNFSKSVGLSVKLRKLSESLKVPPLLVTAYGIQAMTRMFAGKFTAADSFYAESARHYDGVVDKTFGIKFGQDPYITIQGLGAVNKLILQGPQNGWQDIQQSLAAAQTDGHPYTVAESLRVAAMYQQISRNMVELKRYSSKAIALGERYDFDGLLAACRIFSAFSDAISHQDRTALEIIHHELPIYKENYGLLFHPYFQGLLAEAYLFLGQYQHAFTESTHVLLMIDRYGENWSRVPAMLARAESAARGQLTDQTEVNQWYSDAHEAAVSQGATLFRDRVKASWVQFRRPGSPECDTSSVFLGQPIPDVANSPCPAIVDSGLTTHHQYTISVRKE